MESVDRKHSDINSEKELKDLQAKAIKNAFKSITEQLEEYLLSFNGSYPCINCKNKFKADEVNILIQEPMFKAKDNDKSISAKVFQTFILICDNCMKKLEENKEMQKGLAFLSKQLTLNYEKEKN